MILIGNSGNSLYYHKKSIEKELNFEECFMPPHSSIGPHGGVFRAFLQGPLRIAGGERTDARQIAEIRMAYLTPAVNRQPHFSREDSYRSKLPPPERNQ